MPAKVLEISTGDPEFPLYGFCGEPLFSCVSVGIRVTPWEKTGPWLLPFMSPTVARKLGPLVLAVCFFPPVTASSSSVISQAKLFLIARNTKGSIAGNFLRLGVWRT
jgi:hypothetical protein